MPRILPVPDMDKFEYVLVPDKSKRGLGQELMHKVLRRKPEPPEPEPDPTP